MQRLYGLIGYPLGHSFSKQYFTDKFNREGLAQCRFENFPIPSIEDFPSILTSNPSLEAVCVTIPYKEKILPYIHQLSSEVQAVGATNSITIRNGITKAYNTDVIGFARSFLPWLQVKQPQALVLGTGGSSKAVQYVLETESIPYKVVSREPSHSNQIAYVDLSKEMMSEYSVIINCTPLGMQPNNNTFPSIPYEHISPRHQLYDLVYQPAETEFLQRGKAQGALVKNGYDMLLFQAEASWTIWNEPVELLG